MNEEQLSGDSEPEQLIERLEGENDAEYLKRTGNFGHSQTPATKKKISAKAKGSKNPAWVDGRHHTYQRRIKGLKKNDGKVVHHKNENRHDNKPSNLKVMTKAAHNKHHHKKK